MMRDPCQTTHHSDPFNACSKGGFHQKGTTAKTKRTTMFGKDQSLTYKRTQLEHSGIRKIATELAARGHLTGSGKPHVASAIQRCLVGRAASRPPGPNPPLTPLSRVGALCSLRGSLVVALISAIRRVSGIPARSRFVRATVTLLHFSGNGGSSSQHAP